MDFKFCSIHPKVSGGAIPGLKMLRSGFLMNRAQPAPLEMIFAMASKVHEIFLQNGFGKRFALYLAPP